MGLLELGFGVFVLQIQEFENKGVLDGLVGSGVAVPGNLLSRGG